MRLSAQGALGLLWAAGAAAMGAAWALDPAIQPLVLGGGVAATLLLAAYLGLALRIGDARQREAARLEAGAAREAALAAEVGVLRQQLDEALAGALAAEQAGADAVRRAAIAEQELAAAEHALRALESTVAVARADLAGQGVDQARRAETSARDVGALRTAVAAACDAVRAARAEAAASPRPDAAAARVAEALELLVLNLRLAIDGLDRPADEAHGSLQAVLADLDPLCGEAAALAAELRRGAGGTDPGAVDATLGAALADLQSLNLAIDQFDAARPADEDGSGDAPRASLVAVAEGVARVRAALAGGRP